ncbi:S8 family serine peptidase [Acidovorax sp.]|uniref:S8 family serine peptidase n=1 Tax=Acidovorax sp. TaxID=1872122 RepID=UPI00391F4E37
MKTTPKQAAYHLMDLDFALERVVYLSGAVNTHPDSPAQMIVNMSIHTTATYGSDCDAAAGAVSHQTWMDFLYSAGVPIISITGNHGLLNGISHPACSENVIKVAAVPNDGVGMTRASYSNLAAPSNYTKPIFFAPGGLKSQLGGPPVVGAGRASTTATFSGGGTSQAGAHVSGLAALFKSRYPTAGVDAFIDWVNDYASVPMSVTIPAGTFQYRRVAYSTGGP